jgi:hypothetical protein
VRFIGVALDRESMINELGVKRSDIVYKHMRDPSLLRYYYKVKTVSSFSKMGIEGSSPTDIFVGRFGHPYVNIGPLVPPEIGDTSLLAEPERWRSLTIEDIVNFRSKLVRGMYLSKVTDVEKGRMQESVRDLALAERPADTEMAFSKRPFVKLDFRDEVQPFGPSAPMKELDIHNIKPNQKVEDKYFDTDATATTSMVELYDKGVEVSKIQRGLSAGLFGIGRNRRFVPTRWSITAVDDTLGKNNLEEVKGYESVDAIHAYYNVALDNRWLIFIMPGNWQYESIEAWYPGTVWNEDGRNVSIFGSYEGYRGRKTYAEIGGCYYSGRLAITEKMRGIRKQGIALILREVHKGYIMPVGVWNVREHVRETLEAKPEILHTTGELFEFVSKRLDIKMKYWILNSTILKNMLTQKRLNDYLS